VLPDVTRARLVEIRQQRGESARQIGLEIEKLTGQAYASADKTTKNSLSVDAFLNALNDSEVRLQVRLTRPSTLDEAIMTAESVESAVRQSRGINRRGAYISLVKEGSAEVVYPREYQRCKAEMSDEQEIKPHIQQCSNRQHCNNSLYSVPSDRVSPGNSGNNIHRNENFPHNSYQPCNTYQAPRHDSQQRYQPCRGRDASKHSSSYVEYRHLVQPSNGEQGYSVKFPNSTIGCSYGDGSLQRKYVDHPRNYKSSDSRRYQGNGNQLEPQGGRQQSH